MNVLFIVLKILGFGLMILGCVGVAKHLFREVDPHEKEKKLILKYVWLASPVIIGCVLIVISTILSNLI